MKPADMLRAIGDVVPTTVQVVLLIVGLAGLAVFIVDMVGGTMTPQAHVPVAMLWVAAAALALGIASLVFMVVDAISRR